MTLKILSPILFSLLTFFSSSYCSGIDRDNFEIYTELVKQADIEEITNDCDRSLVPYQLIVFSDEHASYYEISVYLPESFDDSESHCGYIEDQYSVTPLKLTADNEILIRRSSGCFGLPTQKLVFNTDHSGLVFEGYSKQDRITGSFSLTPI